MISCRNLARAPIHRASAFAGTYLPSFRWRSRSTNCRPQAMAATDAQAPEQAVSCVYEMGPGTLRIDRRAFHGPIRQGVVQAMKAALGGAPAGIILLKGGETLPVDRTDGEILFRQEAFFHYLFGVNEDGFWGALDLGDGSTTLFMPRLPPSYAVWFGVIQGPSYYKAKYGVERVAYVDEMEAVLSQAAPPCLHLLAGTNTDSGLEITPPSFPGCSSFTLETAALHPVLCEARVHKTPGEVELMRYVNRVGSAAHVAMMQGVRPGSYEYQAESLFRHVTYTQGGCRNQGYTCIAASGPNGAVLHYGHGGAPNDRCIQDGDMLLLDMGCEYYRYGSDITTSWPANGTFTPNQALVYNAVLAAHSAVLGAMAPGVSWADMQTLAYTRILEGLRQGGLLVGEVEEMLEAEVGGLFMPHGLGHLIGIDTHDVGGYGPGWPPRSTRPGFKSLRTARLLEAGMVITVEPGCYFIPCLLDPALKDPVHSKFLVGSALSGFMSFGGVRLEDNVVVTTSGAESLTSVPRSVEDVEAVMAGATWPRGHIS